MHNKSLILALFVFVCTQLSAQNDLSSLLLQDSWQSLSVNPAKQVDGIIINLPGVYNNLWITNLTFDDLVTKEGGSTILDIDNAISKMEGNNIIHADLDIETLGIGISFGKLSLNAGHRLRFISQVEYPKTLPQLIWEGNAQFIGQDVEFGPNVDITAYHEWSLGAAYEVSKQLSVGAKVKSLSGITNANTERSQLSLHTSDDIYQLNLDADFVVNSAGAIDYNGLDDIGFNTDLGKLTTDNLFGKNPGLAFDLGVALSLGKLHLSASAIDLGGEISWEENVNNYTLNGEYEFEGLDVAQQIFDDEESFGDVLDTLKAIYEPVETSNKYTTKVGSKFYFSGQYELSKELQVGLVAFTSDYKDLQASALALSASMRLSSLFRVGGFYGVRNERFDNLGVNASLYTGIVNVHLATDNIISAFRPNDAHLANFRLGLNLVLNQKQDKGENNGGSQFY